MSRTAISTAAAALAALAATLAASAAAAAHLFYRHLRLDLHRRSECPKLHYPAPQRQWLEQWMLHHAVCARHRSAPDSDLL